MLPRFLARPVRLWLALGVLGGAWGAAARPLLRPSVQAPCALPFEGVASAALMPERLAMAVAGVSSSPRAASSHPPDKHERVPSRGTIEQEKGALSALVEGDDTGEPVGEVTPLESEQIGRLLGAAHRELYGVYPGPERWLVAWAHVAHEISRGKTCVENNLGNIVVSRRWRGEWHLRRVSEQDRRREPRWVLQRVRFRSYSTPMEGALDYWRVITGHFGSSLPYFDTGDAAGAGAVLCERGYSTASCEAYGAGLRGLYSELRATHGQPSRKLFAPWESRDETLSSWSNLRLKVSRNVSEEGPE